VRGEEDRGAAGSQHRTDVPRHNVFLSRLQML
jgi:hypothetical protein